MGHISTIPESLDPQICHLWGSAHWFSHYLLGCTLHSPTAQFGTRKTSLYQRLFYSFVFKAIIQSSYICLQRTGALFKNPAVAFYHGQESRHFSVFRLKVGTLFHFFLQSPIIYWAATFTGLLFQVYCCKHHMWTLSAAVWTALPIMYNTVK